MTAGFLSREGRCGSPGWLVGEVLGGSSLLYCPVVIHSAQISKGPVSATDPGSCCFHVHLCKDNSVLSHDIGGPCSGHTLGQSEAEAWLPPAGSHLVRQIEGFLGVCVLEQYTAYSTVQRVREAKMKQS